MAVEVGYCQCGCGQTTPPAKTTNKRFGHVRGQPLPYARGHMSAEAQARNRAPRARIPLIERYWPKVSKAAYHWMWTGRRGARGYGWIGLGGYEPRVQAH